MFKQVYSVRDSKAGVFGAPMVFISHGEAERGFKQAIMNSQTMYSQFAEDYDLYHMGQFDDLNGKFVLLDAPLHMVNAAVLKGSVKNSELRSFDSAIQSQAPQ